MLLNPFRFGGVIIPVAPSLNYDVGTDPRPKVLPDPYIANDLLTVTEGYWLGTGNIFTYQWLQSSDDLTYTPIVGQTTSNLDLTGRGTSLSFACDVTAENDLGTATERSSASYFGAVFPVTDTFTGTNGTLLSAHAPNAGGNWVFSPDDVDPTQLTIQSNHVVASALANGYNNRYINKAVAPSANYTVGMDVVITGPLVSGMNVLIWGRVTGSNFSEYLLADFFYAETSHWRANISSYSTEAVILQHHFGLDITPGIHRLELRFDGNVVSLVWDSFVLRQVDTSTVDVNGVSATGTGFQTPVVISGPGRAGFSFNADSFYIDNFSAAVDVNPAPGPYTPPGLPLTDNFTDTNGKLFHLHVADTGTGWAHLYREYFVPEWALEIQGNAVIRTTTPPAVFDFYKTIYASGAVSTTLTQTISAEVVLSSLNEMRIIIGTNAHEYTRNWFGTEFFVMSDGSWSGKIRTLFVSGPLVNGTGLNVTNGTHTIKFTNNASGNIASVYWDDVLLYSTPITDISDVPESAFPTAPGHPVIAVYETGGWSVTKFTAVEGIV